MHKSRVYYCEIGIMQCVLDTSPKNIKIGVILHADHDAGAGFAQKCRFIGKPEGHKSRVTPNGSCLDTCDKAFRAEIFFLSQSYKVTLKESFSYRNAN